METPSSAPSGEDTADLHTARLALGCSGSTGPVALRGAALDFDEPVRSAHSNKRAALGLAFVGLIVAGILQLVTSSPDTRGAPNDASRASIVFSNAESGACLNWPADAPDKPSFVQCRDDHMFEVAKSVDMNNFGAPCQLAVRQYLGPRYDPNSKFTIGVLWAGDTDGRQSDARNLLCGLQLLGPEGKAVPFKGQVAELDQSKVWPAGTCLGLDSATNRSTDIPVDCAAAHAVEVTGAVNLTERFTGGPPPEPEQDGFIRDHCTRATEAYLAPTPLQETGLTLTYSTVAAASWTAGSRQVACTVASPGDQGLTPLVGTVKSPSAGDQVAVAPPPSAEPSTTAQAPAPVYREPLVPVASEVAPSPTPTASSPAPSPTPSTTSTAPSTSPEAPAPLGPPPGPSEPPTPPPNVIEIPGFGPITLPFPAPPPPPAPEPPPAPAPAAPVA